MRNIYPRSRPGGTAIDCVDLSDHIYLDFCSYLHAIVYLSGFRPRWHLRRRSSLGRQLHFDYFVSPLEINMSFETARTNTPPHTQTDRQRHVRRRQRRWRYKSKNMVSKCFGAGPRHEAPKMKLYENWKKRRRRRWSWSQQQEWRGRGRTCTP